jgi:hypothetical protein
MKRFFSRSNSLALTARTHAAHDANNQLTDRKGVCEMVAIDAQLDRLSMSSINCDAGKCMGSKKQIRVSSKHL